MRKLLSILLILCLAVSLTSCGCRHEWIPANCIAPKTCSICGNTRGKASSKHTWADATCTEARTCCVCSITEGEALGHTWQPATCTSAKACLVCGYTEGNALGHSLVDFTYLQKATCLEEGLVEGFCVRCNQVQQEAIPPHGHLQEEGLRIITKATLDKDGQKAAVCRYCDTVLATVAYQLSAEEHEKQFKQACTSIPYEKYARYPDDYTGTRIKVTGEIESAVFEALDGYFDSVYYISIRQSEYGIYMYDHICVVISPDRFHTRLLEGDIVTFYGTLDGVYNYGYNLYPKLLISYYTIH